MRDVLFRRRSLGLWVPVKPCAESAGTRSTVELELELELILSQMTQKPMLRGEVDCARLHKKGENGRRGVVGGGVGHFVGKRQQKMPVGSFREMAQPKRNLGPQY